MNAERLRRIFLDFGCLTLGFSIIGHQAFVVDPKHASALLLGTAYGLLTLPAGVGIASAIRNGGGGTSTPPGSPSPSESPPPPSLPSSSAPATPGPGGSG